jgi:S1-C subfamily serine protease
MKRMFTLLLASALLMPSLTFADIPTADIFLSSNTVVNQHQELSRGSALKIITPRGHGSGTYVRIGRNYYALTARHVVESIGIVAVQSGLEVVVGEVVFMSTTQDIALVKIPALNNESSIAPIRTRRIRPLEIGEELVYSGYPSQYNTLTSGAIVSGMEDSRYILQGFAWPGSSGSGIIDSQGQIRGVLVAVGFENFHGSPQVLETVVWMEPITPTTWSEIRSALQL